MHHHYHVCTGCGHSFPGPVDEGTRCTYCGEEIEAKSPSVESTDLRDLVRTLIKKVESIEKRLTGLEDRKIT